MKDTDFPIVLGKHEDCGGNVYSYPFKSGEERYCAKCGNFGVSNTPLANPVQSICLIAVNFENAFTCSADCLVRDPSDGVECRQAIATAQELMVQMVDAVLVIQDDEVSFYHGGSEPFRKKAKKVA